MNEQVKTNNLRTFFSNMLFVLFSILGGLVVGLTAGIIGTFIYLVIIFPIVMGFAGGKVITDNAKYMKTTNGLLIVITSVLTAVILFCTTFYTSFLGQYVLIAMNELGGLTDQNLEVAKAVVDYVLEEETGYTGFVGYLLFKANEGVSIGRMFRSNALNLGPIFTWLYWFVELGVIIFITVYTSKEISKEPFCENCNAWYGGKRHIGGIPLDKEKDILNSIKLQDYAAVGRLLEENPDMPSVEFYLQSCKSCEKSNSFLSITRARKENGKLTFVDVLNTTLLPRESRLLLEEIKFPVH